MKSSNASFWFSAFLCFLSVTLFGWQGLYRESGQSEFASTEEVQVFEKLNDLNKGLSAINKRPIDDFTCSCKFGNKSNVLEFEKPEDCGPSRNYLQEQFREFKKIDPNGYFMGGRDYAATASVLPRKCALYIMRRFWKDRSLTAEEKRDADLAYNRTAPFYDKRPIKNISEYKSDVQLFSKCDIDPNGVPQRYGQKACVTEDYVNLVYNSLIDVADCLQVPAKFIAPKLSNESGLHVNAFGLVNDGGIGQFTNQALADVAVNYPAFKKKIDESSKESCQRLRSIPGALPSSSSEIAVADEQRCHAISTPPNPVRSLIYYGVFFHSTKKHANNAFEKTGDSKDLFFKNSAELMKQAGVSNFDVNKIKDMLFVMSYNIGPGRPASIFRDWLKYRIEKKSQYPVTKADFNMNFAVDRAISKLPLGEEREKAFNKKGKPLTFAEYLYAYRNSIYIAAVKEQANLLDKGLGEGTCTEAKFLEL